MEEEEKGGSFHFVNTFCRPLFNGTWASLKNELGPFTPCFTEIVVLGTACLVMVVLSALRIRLICSSGHGIDPRRKKMKLRHPFLHLLALVCSIHCAIVPLLQLSARISLQDFGGDMPLAPFEIYSIVSTSIAWLTVTVTYALELAHCYVPKGHWYLRFALLFMLAGQLSKLRFVLLLLERYDGYFFYLFVSFIAAQAIQGGLAIFYYPDLVPQPGYDDVAADSSSVSITGAGDDYVLLSSGEGGGGGGGGGENICPERRSNIVSRLLFMWMTPLMSSGYKRPIKNDDVWQLDEWDRSEVNARMFEQRWREEREKAAGNPSLLRTFVRCFGFRFMLGGFCKLFNDASQFTGPVFLNLLLKSMQNNEPAWKGYLYSCAIFVAMMIGVIGEGQYFQTVMRVAFHLRAVLIAAIFGKSMALSHTAREKVSTGFITNLISSDVESLQQVCQNLHLLWSAPLRILVAIVLLYRELGYASLVGLLLLVLTIPSQALIVRKVQLLTKGVLQRTDKRIGLTTEVLKSMDIVKCYAWEESFSAKIQAIREDELSWLRSSVYLMALNFLILNVVPVLVSVVTFGVYALNHTLTPASAFTSIALFGVLRYPLITFPQLINQVILAKVSLARVQEMLVGQEGQLDPPLPSDPSKPAVTIKNGNFAWDVKALHCTLKDINLEIPAGQLVAIVGSTGQGKSSLVSAMLGEIPSVPQGVDLVKIHGSVAYVSQISWIFNATVRENVLFGLPFHPQRYAEAIRVSALEEDLEQLPGGDLTEIGERGVNVSGGQKQRISIARAVFANADVYIFDDPLSALDSHVARQVFDLCIKGTLADKTRVLVTNQLHFLPHVDSIVVVYEGRIVEAGTYERLRSSGGAHWAKLMEKAGSLDSEEEDGPQKDEGRTEGGSPATAKGKGQKEQIQSLPETTSTAPNSGGGGGGGGGRKRGGTALVQEEEREMGIVRRAVVGRYISAMGGFFVITFLILSYVFIEISRVGSSLWLTKWSGAGARALHSAFYYIGVYAVISLCQVLFQFSKQFQVVIGSLRATKRLHEGMLGSVLFVPMSFFHTNPLGRIMNRFSKDVADMDRSIATALNLSLTGIFQLSSTFLLIGVLTPYTLICFIPLLAVFCMVYLYFQSTAREVKRLDSITRSPVYAQFSEALNGLATIRAYRAHSRLSRASAQAVDTNVRFTLVNMSANRWLSIRLEFLGGLMILVTGVFAVMDNAHAEDKSAAAPQIGLVLSYALSITSLMTMTLRLASMAENSLNAVERVGTYIDLKPEAERVIPNHRPSSDWPFQGAILFDNVWMRYREDLPPVLKGLTIAVKPTEKIGVVGRTGAGKSSLFNALFRIVELSSGRILIDGSDISQFGVADLRKALSIIPQSPVLFSGTIRFNLDPFDEHKDRDLWEALERAHLKEVISRSENGLDTVVKDSGDNFSVGQRQLLSLARALLRRSKILVLDEATASVDVGTDALIQKTIREEFKNCTMLTIAHRINTIVDSDRILVMDDGKALEYDTPIRLLKKEDGAFASLVKSTGSANAQYLYGVATGDVDIQQQMTGQANGVEQKWAHEAAVAQRWIRATKWALGMTLSASHNDLQQMASGVQDESEIPLLMSVHEAAGTLRRVLRGEHNEALREELQRSGVSEQRWWTTLFRLVEGLAGLARGLKLRYVDHLDNPAGNGGPTEQRNSEWQYLTLAVETRDT
ncbi:hypothetical protein CBR_g37475 [Chara braunii]|uniref:ABC-type xenobiotic transporter n=1 Tax=Chara braunii TaxID=69332 RepID=A0A388LN81_CHABU|nr:hypothetical protein CBR_g37475 [Chara braunii]|eukprot:GBG83673.1 hypothetical protein CBR_g37475 [Chara braunii]